MVYQEKLERTFYGDVYRNEMLSADNKKSFVDDHTYLRNVKIKITENAVLLGDYIQQTYPASVNEVLGFDELCLDTVFFKSATAGNPARINIIGTWAKESYETYEARQLELKLRTALE